MFEIGDKLLPTREDKERYGVDFVTITEINENSKIYNWKAPSNILHGTYVYSSYYFKDAILYEKFNKIPRLNLDNNNILSIDNDFKFKESVLYYDNTDLPYIEFTFKWIPEASINVSENYSLNEVLEIMGEKLKQDFIKEYKN